MGACTKRTYTNESKNKRINKIDKQKVGKGEEKKKARWDEWFRIFSVGTRKMVNKMCSTASKIPRYLIEIN